MIPRPLRRTALAAALALAFAASAAQAADCPPARGGTPLGLVRFSTQSAILPQATLEGIAAAHAGCLRDVPSVEAVIEAVNAAYAAAGAELAFAEFDGTPGGRVAIALVEIRYDRVEVEGAQRTRPEHVRARAGAAPGDLADLRRLRARLARLPETDGLRVEADLRPGAAPQTTTLVLRVDEPPALRANLGLDTTGAVDSGILRATAGVTITSLTGLADPLALTLARSRGSLQAGLSYARALGAEGTRLTLGASVERSEALFAAPPATGLVSTTAQVTLGLSQPLGAEGNDTLTAAITLAHDGARLAGITLSDTRTLEVALGSAHLRRGEGWALGLTQTLRWGRVDDRVTPARSSYLRHDGTLFGLVALGPDWSLGGELRWQYASAPLPAFAQFSATGRSGVRGYGRVGATSDAGVLARLELRRSPFAAGAVTLSPFGFVDAGRGYGRGPAGWVAGPVRASVGLGLDLSAQLGQGRSLTGSIVAAVPLVDALPRVRAGRPELVATLAIGF